MKAYSKDLRERVVMAVEEGKSRREVARLFHVSLSTVKRYLKQWREEGNMDPKPIPGRPGRLLAHQRAKLQAQLETFPDATRAANIVTCGKLHQVSKSVPPR